MDKIIIEGAHPLQGEVTIHGAKNAALPIMAASLLLDGELWLKNLPQLSDIKTMVKLLEHLGVEGDLEKGQARLLSKKSKAVEAPYDLVKTMRASVLVLGPLLARRGRAKVSLPGGCAIGERPIDQHLKGFEALGAKVTLEHGYVEVEAKALKGATYTFDVVSVTGTENLIMAASLAKGETILENAACEPEIVDLANLLIACGAKIKGAGTSTVVIEGVQSLQSTEYRIMPDRIEAGTFLIAGAALPGSQVLVKETSVKSLDHLLIKLKEAGAKLKIGEDSIQVTAPKKLKPVDISTAPYPGFATDLQAQWMALMCLAEGSSVIAENIFENRFMHVAELKRMGADIRLDGHTAFVRGVKKLSGAPVMATDLRASASLVIAALAAEGKTEIGRVYHLDRGYELLEKKFRSLGAKIKRVKG
ncbi:MAG: UDP-N-acetylglucosamine 1-carboxyvinyltransferase [Deltaproteobacteria bacterium]|nr:UDP-N-acetylglucosamine 1-carboxyvinyltransferase [Deltaproteobacteria bacterium]